MNYAIKLRNQIMQLIFSSTDVISKIPENPQIWVSNSLEKIICDLNALDGMFQWRFWKWFKAMKLPLWVNTLP